VLAACACARPGEAPGPLLRAAVLAVEPEGCEGALVGDARHVVVPDRCAGSDSRLVGLATFDGRRLLAAPVLRDPGHGIAILRTGEPLSSRPLEIAERLPQPGEAVYSVAPASPGDYPRVAEVREPAACRGGSGTLCTNMAVAAGDAGMPLADGQGRLVALAGGDEAGATTVAGLGGLLRAEIAGESNPPETRAFAVRGLRR